MLYALEMLCIIIIIIIIIIIFIINNFLPGWAVWNLSWGLFENDLSCMAWVAAAATVYSTTCCLENVNIRSEFPIAVIKRQKINHIQNFEHKAMVQLSKW